MHGGDDMELREISHRVGKLVQRLIDPGAKDAGAAPDFVLGEDGSFDSVWALRLVLEIEKIFAISVNDEDVVPENFRDVTSLTKFVARKLSGVGGEN